MQIPHKKYTNDMDVIWLSLFWASEDFKEETSIETWWYVVMKDQHCPGQNLFVVTSKWINVL